MSLDGLNSLMPPSMMLEIQCDELADIERICVDSLVARCKL